MDCWRKSRSKRNERGAEAAHGKPSSASPLPEQRAFLLGRTAPASCLSQGWQHTDYQSHRFNNSCLLGCPKAKSRLPWRSRFNAWTEFIPSAVLPPKPSSPSPLGICSKLQGTCRKSEPVLEIVLVGTGERRWTLLCLNRGETRDVLLGKVGSSLQVRVTFVWEGPAGLAGGVLTVLEQSVNGK